MLTLVIMFIVDNEIHNLGNASVCQSSFPIRSYYIDFIHNNGLVNWMQLLLPSFIRFSSCYVLIHLYILLIEQNANIQTKQMRLLQNRDK